MSENVIAEFVRFNPILKNHKLFADMEILNINKNIILDLTEENIWMNSYEHSTRKNVNKAIRNNLSVKIINSVDISDYDISTFHNIYINTMERNSAMNEYYYSKDFFKKFKTLLPKNSFYIFVYKDEKVISVELVLFNRYIAYSFLGGTLPEYFQYRPNDFLKHNIIEKLLKLNLSYFNFGGGAKPEDGVFKYKKNFAKNGVYDFYIGKKIYNQKIYDNVVSQWKGTFKDQVDSYENLLLCYRYTS